MTFLTVVPSPYMRDLFRAMRADGRIAPRVLYMAMGMPGFDWGEQRLADWETVLPSSAVAPLRRRLVNVRVGEALAAEPADVYVVGGDAWWTAQVAMRWLRRHGMPWVFFGERPVIHRRGLLGRSLRTWVMRPAVRWPDAIAAAGQAAVDAYRRLCPDETPIANLPYFTALEPFRRRPASPGATAGRFRILYCGQLIERKGVDLLIDAFRRVASDRPGAELVLVGDGPLRQSLLASLPSGLAGRIRFTGFRPVDELPERFAEADAFVLASRHDGWGVVVNQALAAGLPVIASDAVGAALDLVRDGENGFLVPAGDAAALGAAFARIAGDPSLCRRMGENARASAARVDLSAGVDGWFDLLSRVADSHSRNRARSAAPEVL